MVYRLEVAKSQAYFYSMGLSDNTIIEWKGFFHKNLVNLICLVNFLMEEEKDSVYIKNIFKEVEELKEVEEHPISKMLLLELKYYGSNQHDTP